MPSAPLPGQVAKFASPLYTYKKIVKQATGRHAYLFTAKDNDRTAFHITTERPNFGDYALSRWYLKEKVNKVNRDRLDGLYECVLCASCTASCPTYWWNREVFLGPTMLVQAYRWLIEPLDKDFDNRLHLFEHGPRTNNCHNIFNCTITCPKYLNPGYAAKEIKRLYSPMSPKLNPPAQQGSTSATEKL